jgi:sec-independent protein translocase protein TatA
MFNIGPWELALILLVALIVVGPGKLPELAKSIGKGINEFKKVTSGYKKELQDAMDGIEAPVKQLVADSSPEKQDDVIQKDIVPTSPEKQDDSIRNMADNFDAEILEKKE